jgi:hypothetical protein
MNVMRWMRWLGATGLLLIGLLATPALVRAQDAAPPGIVAQVTFADQADLQRLVVRYDVWHVDHAARRATLWLAAEELLHLRAEGRRVVIDHAATADLAADLAAVRTANLAAPVAGGIPGFACYRTVEETYARLDALAAAFPTLAHTVTLGASWQHARSDGAAGYPLTGLVLTNRAVIGPKPVFFLMAAIHAREYTTAETALRFAEQLVAGYGSDADATWLLDYTEIHIVPQANPDGRKLAETGLSWRKNVNNDLCTFDPSRFGVDLNRNSSFKWAQCTGYGCSSAYACDITYRGESAASEPETQALERYLRAIFPDARGTQDTDAAPADTPGLMISLHSYFPKILFPWGWTQTPAPNAVALQTLARKFGFYTGYPACQSGAPGCIYLTDGATDDFAYGELGVAAYTFELGNAFFEACTTFETEIVTPALASLTYAAKAAVQPYILPAGPEVVTVTLAVTGAVQPGAVVTLTATADDGRFFSGGYGDEAVQAIQALRFAVNEPVWASCAAQQPMSPVDDAFDSAIESAAARIDTSGWPPGRYLLLVEAQDTAGVWGAPTGIFLDVANTLGNLPENPYTPRQTPCNRAFLPIVGR